VNSLERRARWLLRVYPAVYRRERGDEIVGTLLEATQEGRAWPRLRDARALVIGGLQARAGQNRQRTTAANARVAVMVGLTLFNSLWVAAFSSRIITQLMHGYAAYGPGSLAAYAVLSAATVVLVWTAPRVSVVTGALAAAAAAVYYLGLHVVVIVPAFLQVLYLAALVALGLRGARPSRRWLWLPSVIAAATPFIGIAVGSGWLGVSFVWLIPGALLLPAALVGILWIGIDARLVLALATYLAAATAQSVSAFIQYGTGVGWLPYSLVVAAIAGPAFWLLRRQSAPRARAS
jgi:hypothetical protein